MSSSPLDWSLYPSFLAILRAGSLSGAARTRGLAHPTLRRHLDELEAAIGAALFVRSASGLVPTPLALALREPAEAMEVAAQSIFRLASAQADDIAGTVRITASEIIGGEVLPPLLARIKADHPAIDFELALTNTIEDILRRDADIAVRMVRPTQPDLVARKVGTIALGLYAHTDWLARYETPATLSALVATRQLVGYDQQAAVMVSALAERGISASPGDFCFRSDSDLAQLAAIRAGVGVGLCQVPIAHRCPGLHRVLPDFSVTLDMWLAVRTDNRALARIRVVLDALAHDLRRYAN